MLTKKKKIIIIVSMVVLLVVTGVLNLKLNATVQQASTNVANADFFVTYRQDRVDTRNQQILILDGIINDKTLSESDISSAVAKKSAISDSMTLELGLESLIGAKGYTDVVVSCTDSFINVILKSGELEEYQVAQIVEIIQSETGKDIDNIKIMSVE